jgi:hypothetical protein
MTVAVFNKGNFVNFWLNDLSNKDWIDRSIASMGWLRQDVEVYAYEFSRGTSDILSFDENKNLQVMKTEQMEITNENNEVEIIDVILVDQTYNKIPVYLNGFLQSV